MAFTGINIAGVDRSGLGKHAYDCTFEQLQYTFPVIASSHQS
jgi:hypothetical protein